MNRRKFFALLPAAPVAVATWPDPAEAAPPECGPHEKSVTLTLNGTMKPTGECMHLNGGVNFASFPKDDPTKRVSMAVGEDGNLWIKSHNGEWRRVVTE